MSKQLVDKVNELLFNLAKMNRGSVGKSMYRGGLKIDNNNERVQELLMNIAKQEPNGKVLYRGGCECEDQYELNDPSQSIGGKVEYDDDNDIWGDKKPKKRGRPRKNKGKSNGVMSEEPEAELLGDEQKGAGDLNLSERVKKLRDGHREWLMKYNALKERGYTPKEAKELIKKYEAKTKKTVKKIKNIKKKEKRQEKTRKKIKEITSKPSTTPEQKHEILSNLLEELAVKLTK